MSGAPPEPAAPPPPGAGEARPASWAARFHTYLSARFELLSIESKEAVGVAAKMGVLAAAIAVAAFFAYALILVALVSLAGRWLAAAWPGAFGATGWQAAALGFGLLHVIAAAVLVALLRRKPGPPLFEFTRSEFQKDREWLQDDPSKRENGS